jgi:hypothetical protein
MMPIYDYIPQLPPDNVQSLQDRYQKLENTESPDGKELWLNWAIRLNNEPVYIGRFEATVIKAEKMAFIAYLLGVDFWNKGYATEACNAVLQELKNNFSSSSESHSRSAQQGFNPRFRKMRFPPWYPRRKMPNSSKAAGARNIRLRSGCD